MVQIHSSATVAIQKSKRAERLVAHIDKLKRFEGDAPECWLTEQTDGTGDLGFSDASAPVSPVTAVARRYL